MAVNHKAKYRPRKQRRKKELSASEWACGYGIHNQKQRDDFNIKLTREMEEARKKGDWKNYYRIKEILYRNT